MRAVYGLLALALLFLLAVPSGLDSCAIAPPAAVFVARKRPADREAFLKGIVPVVLRSYSGPDLIAAFRVLSGKPLSTAEVASVYPRAESSSGYPAAAPISEPWVEIRRNVPGAPPIERLEPYRTVTVNGQMETFLNCQRDAFLRAAATLGELTGRWGATDARTVEWLKAQDAVFANCSGPPVRIPAEAPAGADALLAAHRRYQIAAAKFYAGQFREAQASFRRIAQDAGSPWHDMAPYLEARALLRAGLVDGDQAAFQEGKAALQAILQDPARKDWHPASLNLLHLWQVRVEPRQRLIELGRTLQQQAGEVDETQEVTDFLYLLDRTAKPGTMADAEGSELAAWVLAVSGKSSDASSGSMAWWRKEQKPVWLVAALMNAEESDSAELVRAARKLAASSPAYESASYYAIEREMRSGRAAEAREWADRVLAGRISRSTRNLLLERRMGLARNWNEFLKFAPRRPEPDFAEFEDREGPAQEDPLPGGPFFLTDAQQALNRQVPLALWLDATRNPLTPGRLQLRLAYAGWLRAIMLERFGEARQFLQRAIELQADSSGAAKVFLEARDDEEARYAAIRLVLRAPSICPSAPYPELSETSLAQKHRMLLRGWVRSSCWVTPGTGKENPPAGFLTAEQVTEGRKEAARVYGQPSWEATVLLRETVAWAGKHPEDAGVPEALHDAILAARYRQTDRDTGTYSRRAFDLLHRQYAQSPWAARTPYWYQ